MSAFDAATEAQLRVLQAGAMPETAVRARERKTPRAASKDSTLARFAGIAPDPENVLALRDDHPAILEGRTIFPNSVVGAFDSPRFLVSGHNSSKLGRDVRKGPWRGMPIFHLTLEERATCPRSCLQWATCYGNAMPYARRHDHTDPDFLPALKAEIVTLARQHRDGFAVRLHSLGDFYSVAYVQMWADLLDALPNLRCFGYTARREDADDEESRRIAKAVRWLTDQAWDVFAIRMSGRGGPQGAVVVDSAAEAGDAILCPAQTHRTEACATCALCWSSAAHDKAIAFLRHGMKRRQARVDRPTQGADAPPAAPRARKRNPEIAARNAEWRRRYEAGETLADIADQVTTPGHVRAGILSAGGEMRSRERAAQLRWAEASAKAALARQKSGALQSGVRPGEHADKSKPLADPRGFRPENNDRTTGRTDYTPLKFQKPIAFSPGEQEALVAAAIAEGKVTQCQPGHAFGATPQRTMVGATGRSNMAAIHR